MAKARTSKRPQIPKVSKKDCPYCKAKTIPVYREYQELKKFISDRSKIIPSMYTGVCSKHERYLSIAVKRARFLGLLPYSPVSQ